MTINSHRDLLVWQKAMDLVVLCYELARVFPKAEQFGLCSQLQRAAVSVPANIAEGLGRRSTNAYLNHLSIASGSLMEIDTHLLIAQLLGYISYESAIDASELSAEVGRMLSGLRKSLQADTTKSKPPR